MSLGLGWVNVFPVIGLGGKIMKGMALAITLLLFSDITSASDCFDMAGRDYKIDPDLLRAISWQESHFKIDAIAAILSQVMGQVLCKLIHNISTNCRGMELNPITFLQMHV